MPAETPDPDMSQMLKRARQALTVDDFDSAIAHYEAAIEADPECRAAYWELGVASVLADREEDAQTLWFSVMMAAGEAEAEWLGELLATLKQEAERYRVADCTERAWLLRRHAYEIAPDDATNTIALIEMAIAAQRLAPEDLTTLNVAEIAASPTIDRDRWLALFQTLLDRARGDAALPAIARATLTRADLDASTRQKLYPKLAFAALSLGVMQRQQTGALALADVALEIRPNDFEVLSHTVNFYRQLHDYDRAIERAECCESAAPNEVDRAFATALRLQCLLATGGHWSEALEAGNALRQRLSEAIDRDPRNLTEIQSLHVLTSTFSLGYLRDRPELDRPIVNRAAALAQANLAQIHCDRVDRYQQQHARRAQLRPAGRKLRIGFLSDSLRSHSVGWLARWPFEYYDRDRFEFHTYLLNSDRRSSDPVQAWYIERATNTTFCGIDGGEIADRIAADEIDILLDLDSLTVDIACAVMALAPAPVQCSWLGFDASGLPTIDYYIADALTLPDDAQSYYAETIWRLPHSYIAIDGFEQAVPTLHRRDLGITPDAIVYFTNQTGQKRNPDLIRLQLEIVREVPGSQLLVKGLADAAAVRGAFEAIADEVGVARDRLHFLGRTRTEEEHRANLAIADVVLDTYPYNGATTTLETLWGGIPLVTRAGRQFSGRNSFAMLKQVGVEAGIAWSDREYVEWGVRFGREEALRQAVAWQLRRSRQGSVLWDGRGLTRDLEAAFEEMWLLWCAVQSA